MDIFSWQCQDLGFSYSDGTVVVRPKDIITIEILLKREREKREKGSKEEREGEQTQISIEYFFHLKKSVSAVLKNS